MKISTYPTHIAFIMDGNRRWAVKHGFNKLYGHEKGAEALADIIETLTKYPQIRYASFFAFSTENWNRGKEEIDAIFELIRKTFDDRLEELKSYNVKFVCMGDISPFPDDLKNMLLKVLDSCKNNTGLTVNLAINYGGKSDIVRAVNKALESGKKQITEQDIEENLYSYPAPPIDLVVRTSGEMRISNFMLFQLAYSELYFPKVCWPAFDEKQLLKALKIYSKRNRRFGGN